tara:strand:+ start:10420 stop:14247 length:3828 start_codon:yes stop_codon:yes gene_type:complete
MPRYIVFFAVWLVLVARSSAADRALTLSYGTDLVEAWIPGQHVYVKGNLGISSGQLNQLEAWMDDHGENWIILLAQNASGEQIRDAAGNRYMGIEAVEVAANVIVRNQTEFGELTDSRSGEKSGSVFILFLSERKFSYSGGEVHETRGLGAKNWSGDLDRPAFRAMSGGGRVIDAVKGTVKEVTRRLDQQFQIERERRQREIEAAKRLHAEAESLLEQAGSELDELEEAVNVFVDANGNPPGDLARPPLSDFRKQLEEAALALNAEKVDAGLRQIRQVRDFVRVHAGALLDYPQAGDRFAGLAAELAEVEPGDENWGRERLKLAEKELELAEDAHSKADSTYVTHLNNAIEAFDSAKVEIRRAEEELRRKQQEEARLVAEREKRERLSRVFAVTVEILLVLGAIGTAWWLSRRRRSTKMAALSLYDSWDRGVREQTDALFGLLDRSATVVGSAANLAERGYSGETLRLSKQIIEDVDELFIMSACVRRVLKDVGQLIRPTNPLLQIFNQFFADRYDRGNRRLRDELIRFHPDEGIEPILRDERGEPERILGHLEAHQAFELSFPALIEACNQHVTRATQNLGIVEKAWASISETQEALQTDCDSLAGLERKLASAASEDGFFAVENLFDQLIPEIQNLLDRTVDLGTTDPVGALNDPAKDARRLIRNGISLAEVLLRARKQRFAAMKSKSEQLRKDGVETGWIGRFLAEYSLEADGIAEAAIEHDVSKSISDLEARINKLDQRISKALKLSESVGEIAKEHIETVQKSVDEARKTLSEKLQLPGEEVLVESGLNPDDRLMEAVKLQNAAQIALNRGGVDAAEAALVAAHEETEDAMGLIAVSKAAFEKHEERSRQVAKTTGWLDVQIEKHTAILQKLQKRYLPPALRQFHEEPSTTVEDNISEASKALDEARLLTMEAEEAFKAGRLIESASFREQVANLHQFVQTLLGEIKDQADRLKRLESENLHDFHRLEDRADAMRIQAKDSRTMRASIEQFDEILADVSAVGESLSDGVADPIEDAAVLEQIADQLSDLFKRVQADWKLHEEAGRSLAAARSQLTAAEDLVRLAQTDDLPDSPQITALADEVEALRGGIAKQEARMNEPHQNWNALDADADRIHTSAGRATAALQDELKRAEDAIRAISLAARKIRHAAGWSGAHGVRILGSPGAGSLERAREQLLVGSYLSALRLAEDGRAKAQRALANAETEVARRRRVEQRRREEARRRALEQARRSAVSMTRSRGGGFGGGFGGRGGSGMGGSSFRGGSGMGRSGW